MRVILRGVSLLRKKNPLIQLNFVFMCQLCGVFCGSEGMVYDKRADMEPESFIITAYALTAILLAGLCAATWRAAHRAKNFAARDA